MKGFLTLYKIEQKLFFRSPDVFVFNLCMPVVVLLLIGFIAGGQTASIQTDGQTITYIQSAFASLTAVGICCSAFMSIPIVMVDYRDKKILKRLYCSPASPARLLAATSRPVVSSSRKTISGLPIRERTTESFCLSPPESFITGLLTRCSSPNCSSRLR